MKLPSTLLLPALALPFFASASPVQSAAPVPSPAPVQSNPDAPVITNNQDLTYVAHILRDPHSGIEGVVTASPGPNNTGVQIKLHFSGLRETSRYLYHIHYQPMPESGDCKGTAGLLNPYNAQEDPCNAAEPQTCGVGDLSGKHGFLIADDYGTVAAVYEDKYLSNQPDSVAFFGNRSVTIHADDGGRYNCGNFELQ